MDFKKVIACVNECLWKSTKELQEKLDITIHERDIYKELLKEKDNIESNIVYATIYIKDNGEGVDTESCIGVFSKKSLALQAILDVCKNNAKLNINQFNVVDVDVGKVLKPNDIVYLVQCDEEANCEVSTRIVSICCEPFKENKLYYSEKYTVDMLHDDM